MFKNNGDCPKIKNSNRLSIGLVALITLFVLIFIITVLGYRSDFVTHNEQETKKRLEMQAEQVASKKERQELRDRLTKLETEVKLLKNEH